MKILVTGGAGFIGSHLILRLLKEDHEVICIDNMNGYYDPSLKEDRINQFKSQISFEKIDITDRVALESLIEKHKPDKIAHLAAQAGVRYSLTNPDAYVQSNFAGTANIFEFAVKYGIKDIVFASTSSVYGDSPNMPFKETEAADKPISIYAATKRACEVLASSYFNLYQLNVTCLRFFTVYGPFGRPDMALFKFTKNILDDIPIDVYNNGSMKRDFTFVSDIVDGFISALKKQPSGFEIINLGHGKPAKLMDFIKVVEKELGKEAKINFMPMQKGDVLATYADVSKAKEMLGFKARIGIEEGVRAFIEWYKDYYKV